MQVKNNLFASCAGTLKLVGSVAVTWLGALDAAINQPGASKVGRYLPSTYPQVTRGRPAYRLAQRLLSKRFENGERVEGLSNQTDMLPTVVEMLGYEIENAEYPGYSLLHPLPENRTLNFSCISSRKYLASINGDEKYIYHYDNQPEEVYDLSNDPLEEHNLADQYSNEELDRRREDIFRWLSSVNSQYGGDGRG